MCVFILEDLGEIDAARVLLSGLLASGVVPEEKEFHFLTERLKTLETAGKSSPPTRK